MPLNIERIKQARLGKGLSQDELSRAADIPLRTYLVWEQGRGRPNIEGLYKLAQFHGKPMEWFLEED